MFDLPLPIQPSPRPMGPVPNGPAVAPDPSLPFALTRMHRTPAALMSGTAAPVVVANAAEVMGWGCLRLPASPLLATHAMSER